MDRVLVWLLAQFLTIFVWICQLIGLGQHWLWALRASIDIGEHWYISGCAGLLVWLSTWWITPWPSFSTGIHSHGRTLSVTLEDRCIILLRYSLVLFVAFVAHLWHDGLL